MVYCSGQICKPALCLTENTELPFLTPPNSNGRSKNSGKYQFYVKVKNILDSYVSKPMAVQELVEEMKRGCSSNNEF